MLSAVHPWVSERAGQLWRLAAGLYTLAAAVVVWEHAVGALPAERWVTRRLYHRFDGHERLHELALFLTAAAGTAVVVPTLLVASWFVWRAYGARWAALVPLSLVPVLVAQAVKVSTEPTELAREGIEFAPLLDGGSLPSGHAAYAISLFGLLSFLSWGRDRQDMAGLFAGLVVAIGLALVIAGLHFPGDVLAGFALGGAWLLTAILVKVRLDSTRRNEALTTDLGSGTTHATREHSGRPVSSR
jgi:undecaprenyl-diphosphatase